MAVKRTANRARQRAKQESEKKNAPRKRIKDLVEVAIQGLERRIHDDKSPPSIGDYLKVMQLQKEIEDDAPKEIKVTWVEPEKTPESER